MSDYVIAMPVAIFSQMSLLIFILLIIKRNKAANKLLTMILLIFAVGLLGVFFRGNRLPVIGFFHSIIHIPLISLFGPLVYFYTRDMVYQHEFKLFQNKKHLISFFVLSLLNVTSHVHIYLNYDISKIHPRRIIGSGDLLAQVPVVISGVSLFLALVYTIFSAFSIKTYSAKIEQFFSDVERVSLNWMKIFISLIFSVFIIINIVFWMHISHSGGAYRKVFFIPLCILQFSLVFILTYYIINQPDIFREVHEMEDEIGSDDPETGQAESKKKYSKQNISEDMQKKYLNQLLSFMKENKPYLNDSITLKELALELEIPGHHLSIVINNMLGKNFYNFINEYRVNEVVTILKDPLNRDANILTIAFKSGFNSKSSFNNVFKKVVGATPTEFRRTVS